MKKKLDQLLSYSKNYFIEKLENEYGVINLQKPVILFGAGQMADSFIEICNKNKIEIVGIIDNDEGKHNRRKNNYIIRGPDALSGYEKDIQIIITSINCEEILSQLSKMGFKKSWSHEYMSTVFPHIFHNPYWLNSIESILNSKSKILNCFALLGDDVSKKIYYSLLVYRLTLHKEALKRMKSSVEEEYFDPLIVGLGTNDVYVDGGAYTGDTIKKFVNRTHNKFKTIYAFEPDTNLFNKIVNNISIFKDRRIKVIKCGLGSKNGSVSFTNDGTLGSRISQDGTIRVKIVSLDKFLDEIPTIIKFDIEGAELEAIEGAKNLITNHKPMITLSAYHKTEDLWEIPLLLKKLRPDYMYILRHYGDFLYDTIYYAV
ncbi:hypothetical protein COV49_01150 [Candidatus Falkowbacteria bacterium CG11_big_fil_rev_8_21_14_0_20_39_10]|uniref:Methyltransferase FkbM domain-containing protein n=1 Tax=Candidatus Falkowbacteria bacterium CG11_big_fil_rev_8_21_14_0_20_39_10 TaxID=1974570 RepID=A0A2M6K9W2_9BACT|nr:MAG: hypothetical protein COV49_01150 [Candidatus Falkowbacteria bacterium CG11_big_fil_rev_8_21_14_0_20_39_10]